MRLSLLRSPKNPDPECDMGHHKISYAIYPHKGSFQDADVIREGFNFNVPLLVVDGGKVDEISHFSVDNNAVVLDTIKKAENSNNVVLRFYESFGCHGTFRVTSHLPVRSVKHVNVLEHAKDDSRELQWNGGVTMTIKPFELVTLLLEF